MLLARRRRNAELGLVLLAIAVTTAAYALASLGRDSSVPADFGPFLGVVIALLLGAHLATRWLAPSADPVLLPMAVLLNGIGYVFIARLAGERGVSNDLPSLQATWTALGVGAYVATLLFVRRVRLLATFRYTFAVIGVVLLILPAVPGVGREINGARIWVSAGPVNFQPGEFAKLALAAFFAAYLADKRELLRHATWRLGPLHLPEAKHLGPVALAWGISLLVMVRQKDLGTSLLFFALFVILLWVATARVSYLLVSIVLFAAGASLAWQQFAHVQARVETWLHPGSDPKDSGFQILEASYSLADGGLSGTGLGRGVPDRIPEVETDFIFAAIGEELGLIGATAVLCAYLLMIGAGLRIANRATRPFEALFATGLTVLIGIQAFIIIGGVIRLVPLTGITLPFVSYGGSSLLANYVLMALLMRMSDEAERPVPARGGTRRAAAPDAVGAGG